MATESIGETPTLFLRKATGLVRGWSVRDTIIYACTGHELRDARHLRVHLRRPGLPDGPADHLDRHLGRLGVVPGHRLRRPDRDDPAGGRRLRLADPHPGQRPGLRDGGHRLVVHPVALGPDLRQHPGRPVLRAAVGHARSGPGRTAARCGSARPPGPSWSRSSRSPSRASSSRSAWPATRGSRSGPSTAAWSASGSSSCCCWSTATPASSARSTWRRTSCSA